MKIRTDTRAGAACYTVQQGDNLSFIAQRFYGAMTPSNVNKIYYSNMATIGANPNYVFAGQKLYIPD